MTLAQPPLSIRLAESVVVVPPPGAGPGCWAGAPSAVMVDGVFYLAYRLRRPIGLGRGFANVVARSTDGVTFEPLVELPAERFGAESLERPALAVTPGGTWRLYVSCATPGTKHWRIDLVEALTPAGLADAPARTVLPGNENVGVKDPVVRRRGEGWQMWYCCHPLTYPEHADRMSSEYATSPDGVSWSAKGPSLVGRAGSWDSRGARITAVLNGDHPPVAFYDGRATVEENWEERTGWAVGSDGLRAFTAVGDRPLARSGYGLGGLRYLSVVELPDGGYRLYYETTREDGAHELRTQLT